ncbi:MAG: fructose-6-phosphate aldolase [Bacteroidetes bacterium GWC2_33_15]|nr:MAG: fructose-6-phosphate aldolase [Bacteroidetes bacterium GWA2_33_15]OFX50959.1 MAG: fructose-6-phosphate aldolase [Bacteroidetes bacterium GWC2_33_15]OFX66535.1 MAG: fructose-6-phosphate aldolase [Bacteroidetes bacterium GWB2_32_14]OFX70185.1 MAG: fructose-6-phosphate aldolase [Bacteroidetes bacterium GWD2_33_33]HAN20001.1 fructose-6-phosphate aldolase [Bacteroidales bacterium]
MYFLKTKGTDKIPDYVQLRDDQFVLIAHFKTSHPEQAIKKSGFEKYETEILRLIQDVPFGKLYKLDL